jgi:GNAT superfamily N-acetyltransferase
MAPEPQVARFERSDEADAIGMLLGKLPPRERESAYNKRLARWKWQYYANPNNPNGRPLIWVARVGGAFAGMVATIPVKVKTPRGPSRGMWGVDFIVSSRMRGVGIGKRLLTEWLKTPGIAFVMGWSPVSFKVAQGVGFEVIWGFTAADVLLSRLGYAVAQVRLRQRRNLKRLAGVFWRTNPRPAKHVTDAVEVERTLPEGAGELWRRVSEAYAFAVERDDAYLRWRFEDHPTHEYRYICLREAGALSGLAICRLTSDSPPLGVAADLLVDPRREDLVSRLFDATMAFLRSGGAYAARMDLPPALAGQIVRRYKCSMVKERGMILHTDDPELHAAGILKPGAWYIGRSDADEDY